MDIDEGTGAIRIVRGLNPGGVRARNLALVEQPPLFDIEVASACNVVCTFCPRDEVQRSRALMEEDTFEALLGFLPVGAVAMLAGLGDPLLHPRLPDLVRRLTRRDVSTCLITNGVRLTPERQDALIDAGVAEIQVSVHGIDETIVRTVMPSGSAPDTVRRQVERLAAAGGPRLRINFVETPENAGERDSVERWAERIGARFFFRRQHTRGGTIGVARSDAGCLGCGIFGSVTFISSDGDVLPCVNDARGEGRFGNVRDLTWADALAWKREVIEQDRWFSACGPCDDDYRWVLLARGGLDEPQIGTGPER